MKLQKCNQKLTQQAPPNSCVWSLLNKVCNSNGPLAGSHPHYVNDPGTEAKTNNIGRFSPKSVIHVYLFRCLGSSITDLGQSVGQSASEHFELGYKE